MNLSDSGHASEIEALEAKALLQEVVGYHDSLTKRYDLLLENYIALSKELVSL